MKVTKDIFYVFLLTFLWITFCPCFENIVYKNASLDWFLMFCKTDDFSELLVKNECNFLLLFLIALSLYSYYSSNYRYCCSWPYVCRNLVGDIWKIIHFVVDQYYFRRLYIRSKIEPILARFLNLRLVRWQKVECSMEEISLNWERGFLLNPSLSNSYKGPSIW